MKNFSWSKQNQKLKKTELKWKERFGKKARIISFNIPQLRSATGQSTCPYAGACADVCYAAQGRLALEHAQVPRESNLERINSLSWKEFVDKVVSDIHSFPSVTHIRLHDSGDFFNKSYYKSWMEVAREVPGKIIYAYTKSIPFISWDDHPRNFRIVQSLGGKRDKDVDRSRPHSKIFVSDIDRKREGYCDGNDSDIPAIIGNKKIGLVYHGNRNLRENDIVKLRRVS